MDNNPTMPKDFRRICDGECDVCPYFFPCNNGGTGEKAMTQEDESFVNRLIDRERRDFWKGVIRDLVALAMFAAAFVAIWCMLP